MPDTYTVEPREVTGKKVARLRREGLLPAVIYGRGLLSVAVQMSYIDARDLMNEHGKSTLITVKVAGEAEARPVIVRQIAQNPVTRALLHLDFYQVDLTRLLTASIPLVLAGTAPAVARWGGVLSQGLERVEVEALPRSMPLHLEVPVASLAQIGDQITLGAVRPPAGVRILTPLDSVVATVQHSAAQTEDNAAEEAAVAEEAAAE
ncbi:MAG: 50S ribosomal protein L25 [Chloroflexi bacterium]|nr:MAG: 50S ribosomal protein L25 [Chloroflexota bacterium]